VGGNNSTAPSNARERVSLGRCVRLYGDGSEWRKSQTSLSPATPPADFVNDFGGNAPPAVGHAADGASSAGSEGLLRLLLRRSDLDLGGVLVLVLDRRPVLHVVFVLCRLALFPVRHDLGDVLAEGLARLGRKARKGRFGEVEQCVAGVDERVRLWLLCGSSGSGAGRLLRECRR
jgi:hypothetical protein